MWQSACRTFLLVIDVGREYCETLLYPSSIRRETHVARQPSPVPPAIGRFDHYLHHIGGHSEGTLRHTPTDKRTGVGNTRWAQIVVARTAVPVDQIVDATKIPLITE